MTFKELYQLESLKKEIAEQKRRLNQLRAAATALNGNSDGIPKSAGASDRIGAIVAEIATLEALLSDKLVEYWRTYMELERYISNMPDSFTRRIFRMRFIDGKSWDAIAYKCGGKQTGNALRMICKRFLKNN